jgi:PAS domain S-box-containing protein
MSVVCSACGAPAAEDARYCARCGTALVDVVPYKDPRATTPVADLDRRFRALVEHSADAIALVARDGTILYTSPAAGQILGYNPAEQVGTAALDWVHPEDQAAARALMGELLARPGGSARIECRMRHQDGTWRWVEAVGTNLLDEPSVGALVANYRDITERKELGERLRQASQLEGQLQGITLTARELADRLSNQLIPAYGLVEILQMREDVPADLRELARSAAAHLDEAIQDIEKLSQVVRIETHSTPIGPALDLDRSTETGEG